MKNKKMYKNMNNMEKISALRSKYNEYSMKIYKMSGDLADYYIDRAIESDDYSNISGFLIDLFSGNRMFDIKYLIAKYKEFGLDEKIEDVYFDVEEWINLKTELDQLIHESENEYNHVVNMDEDEYIQYMIDKNKKELEK
jgi:hypothetical protein